MSLLNSTPALISAAAIIAAFWIGAVITWMIS